MAGKQGIDVELTTAGREYTGVGEDVEEAKCTWSHTKLFQGGNKNMYNGTLNGKIVAVGVAKQGRQNEERLRAECFRHEEVVDEAASAKYSARHLLPVYACVDTLQGDTPVVGIVMPKAASSFWKESNKMEPNQFGAAIRDMTRGLADMHEAKYAHRDIKPSNIIMKISGEPDGCDKTFGCAYMTDFTSMIHAEHSPEYQSQEKEIPLIRGTTAFYVPREMVKYALGTLGEKYKSGTELLTEAEATMSNIDIKKLEYFARFPQGAWFRHDVYSLGATLFEAYASVQGKKHILLGQALFEEDDPKVGTELMKIANLLDKTDETVLQQKFDKAFERFELDGCLGDLLKGMLAIDPEARFTAEAAAQKAVECFGEEGAGKDEL